MNVIIPNTGSNSSSMNEQNFSQSPASPPMSPSRTYSAADVEKATLRAEKAEWRVQYLEGCVKEWKRQNKQLRIVVEEQAGQVEEGLTEREVAVAAVTTQLKDREAGLADALQQVDHLRKQVAANGAARSIPQDEEVATLRAANRHLQAQVEQTHRNHHTLIVEREAWSETIAQLKIAVRDTVNAAAQTERTRMSERETMQIEMAKAIEEIRKEYEKQASGEEANKQRKAREELESATTEAMARVASIAPAQPTDPSLDLQKLVEQISTVEATSNDAVLRQLEELEKQNHHLEVQVLQGEESLSVAEAQLATAQAKIEKLEGSMANIRACSPVKRRPSFGPSNPPLGEPRSEEDDGEPEVVEDEEQARVAKANERKNRREIEMARLRAEGRI